MSKSQERRLKIQMKPEEQWTATDYWNDLPKGELELETYIRVGNELAEHAAQLEAELVLYKKVTAMPKLLWDLRAESERLREAYIRAYNTGVFDDDALKEGG